METTNTSTEMTGLQKLKLQYEERKQELEKKLSQEITRKLSESDSSVSVLIGS